MSSKQKSWQEKLADSKGLPKVEQITDKMSKKWGERTLKSNGELNEKYPGGIEAQKKLLEKEGHKVIQKGKKYVIVYLEKYLGK